MDRILSKYQEYNGAGEKELEVKLKWNNDQQLLSDRNLEVLKKIPNVTLEDITKNDTLDFYNGNRRMRFGFDGNLIDTIEKQRIDNIDMNDWNLRVTFSAEKKTQPFEFSDLVRVKKTRKFVLKYKTTTVSVDVSDVVTISKQIRTSEPITTLVDQASLIASERDVEIELLQGSNWRVEFEAVVYAICKAIMGTMATITFKERTDLNRIINKYLFAKEFGFVKFRPNQPVPLTLQEVQAGAMSRKHSVSLKYDGVRKLLFGINLDNKIYFGYASPSINVISIAKSSDYRNFYDFLLDGELVEYNELSVYCAFDIMIYGKGLVNYDLYDVDNKGTGSRLLYLKELFKYLGGLAKFKDQSDPTNVKTVYGLPGLSLVLVKKLHRIPNPYNIKSLADAITSIYDDKVLLPGINKPVKFNDDGLIFTPVDRNYFGIVYKWKPAEKMTNDFYIMKDGTLGMQSVGIIPFVGSEKYPIKEQKTNEQPGRIGEFLWKNDKFVLERWRDDKTSPNSVKTATSNWDLIMEPLELDVILERSTVLMNMYHKSVKDGLVSFIKGKGIDTIGTIQSNTRSRAIVINDLHNYNLKLVKELKEKFVTDNSCYIAFYTLDRKSVLKKMKDGELNITKDGSSLFQVKGKESSFLVKTTNQEYNTPLLSVEDFINELNEKLLFNFTPVIDEQLNMNKKNYFQGVGISDVERQISEMFRVVVLRRDIIPHVQDINIRNMFILKPQESRFYDRVDGIDMYRIGVPPSTSSFFYAICQVFMKEFRSLSELEKIDYIRGLRADLSIIDSEIRPYHYYPTDKQIKSICSHLKIDVSIVDAYNDSVSETKTNANPKCYLLFFDQHYEILGQEKSEGVFKVIF